MEYIEVLRGNLKFHKMALKRRHRRKKSLMASFLVYFEYSDLWAFFLTKDTSALRIKSVVFIKNPHGNIMHDEQQRNGRMHQSG